MVSGGKERLVWKSDSQPLETAQEQLVESDVKSEDQASALEEEPNPEELTQQELTQEKTDEPIPVSGQVLLAGTGLAVCAACGMAAAGLKLVRKRK